MKKLSFAVLAVSCLYAAFAQAAAAESRFSSLADQRIETRIIPKAVRTVQDGYLVAGSIAASAASAVRLDKAGLVVWKHETTSVAGQKPLGYVGAVPMADGSIWLCGSAEGSAEDKRPIISGQVTHLDSIGRVLSENVLSPNEGSIPLNYVLQCSAWQDGIVLLGRMLRSSRREGVKVINEYGYWIVLVDNAGQIVWERSVPSAFDAIDAIGFPIVAANRNLLFTASRHAQTEIVQIAPKGDLVGKAALNDLAVLVSQLGTNAAVELITQGSPTPSLYSYGSDLMLRSKQAVSADPYFIKRVYRSAEGRLYLFGYLYEKGRDFASVFELSREGRQTAAYVYEPRGAAPWIDDAVPSGRPGEFVTVRRETGAGGVILGTMRVP